jgi:hypothetical protein
LKRKKIINHDSRIDPSLERGGGALFKHKSALTLNAMLETAPFFHRSEARLQGVYGPGGTRKTLNGKGIFRRQIMDVELVSQLTLIPTWRVKFPRIKSRLAAYAGARVTLVAHRMFDYLFKSPIYTMSILIILALALKEAPPFKVWTPVAAE